MNIDKAFAAVQVTAEKEKAAMVLLEKAEARADASRRTNNMRLSLLDARYRLAQARKDAAYERYNSMAKALRQEPDPRISDMKLP